MIEIPELISLVNSTNYLIDSFINQGCRNIETSLSNSIKRKLLILEILWRAFAINEQSFCRYTIYRKHTPKGIMRD